MYIKPNITFIENLYKWSLTLLCTIYVLIIWTHLLLPLFCKCQPPGHNSTLKSPLSNSENCLHEIFIFCFTPIFLKSLNPSLVTGRLHYLKKIISNLEKTSQKKLSFAESKILNIRSCPATNFRKS